MEKNVALNLNWVRFSRRTLCSILLTFESCILEVASAAMNELIETYHVWVNWAYFACRGENVVCAIYFFKVADYSLVAHSEKRSIFWSGCTPGVASCSWYYFKALLITNLLVEHVGRVMRKGPGRHILSIFTFKCFCPLHSPNNMMEVIKVRK